ncbi:hypothetical protein CIG75_15760 [Tumebacillus algifaecis]|uniref:Uncharacterized protein n=1 Tax=Tumebacillus algifaecis TaxID=1214604 RepID=A0A223D4G6_9BACL|nr:hypothetical protein [Tumebacillus algifaecis]ASS76254.1 hypothetical protein CIG75_15760 [Tumebacillus algifaecis]
MHPIIPQIQSLYERNVEERFGALYTSQYRADSTYWIPELRTRFANCLIENETDLNYAKCFSYKINLVDTNIGWNQQHEYLKNHPFHYWLEIQLSILEPYAMVKFERDRLVDEKLAVEFRDSPFLPEHANYEATVLAFLAEHGIQRLYDDALCLPVPGVELELQEDTPSVYNSLFEDLSSFFPY